MSLKLLIVLLAVLAGVWLFKRGRRLPDAPRPPRPASRPALPMVRCARCGTHVPGNEALPGRSGSYCSAAHRQESEGA
ncbi:MAG: PP0621 family protein [Pseudomonadota bacterium]|nr:PP0621 family protein [Pseudomonadota bacterium]